MGSGKSTCANYMGRLLGAEIIDADGVAKQLMQKEPEIRWMLVKSFGEHIFDKQEISFFSLGKKVFSEEENLLRLNAIVHPFLVDRLWEMVRNVKEKPVILDAALISYWRIEQLFDILIWVHSCEELRVKRLEKKTKLPPEEIRTRMHLQQSLFSSPSGTRWHVLSNEDSPEKMRADIDGLIRSYDIQQGANHDIG